MNMNNDKIFVRGAFQALIDRGVAKPEDFSPSMVSDVDIRAFEKKYDVILPSLMKAYLQAYCYNFSWIRSPVPCDIEPFTIQSNEYEMHLLWLELLSVPMENPLEDLAKRLEGFREIATDEYLSGMTQESIAHLLPIGDWYAGAGALCIDLRVNEEDVDIRDRKTWSLHFFDHEEFDWQKCYTDDKGMASGQKVVPDFRTLLEWYFYGKFDKAYEEDEVEKPDYASYIKW